MVAFSEEHGGMLTEKQIDVLVEGIAALERRIRLRAPYPHTADPWATWPKARLHSARSAQVAIRRRRDRRQAGSVVHPAYLGLVSDQYLRTIVIAGRNDLGCRIFRIAFRASRCPKRKFPASWPGWSPRERMNLDSLSL